MKLSVSLFALVLIFSATVFSQDQLILENDFEKGKQNWETRGDQVSIKNTKDQAANGKRSLKVSKRNANWNGTQLNITKILTGGNIYRFTVSVKLDEGEKDDEIKLTMQRGDDQFGGVGKAKVSSDKWTTISGNFNIPSTDPYLLVFVEAERPETSFYIDDFKIELVKDEAPPEQKGTLIKNDFEDKTAQNWFVLGRGVEIFSTTAGGSRSLKVANRTQKSHGLVKDISPHIYRDRTYQISASVKLVAGEATDKLKMKIQQTARKGDKITFVEIVPATEVTTDEWVTLEGEYTAKADSRNILVIVEAEGENTSFYLDDFELKVP